MTDVTTREGKKKRGRLHRNPSSVRKEGAERNNTRGGGKKEREKGTVRLFRRTSGKGARKERERNRRHAGVNE